MTYTNNFLHSNLLESQIIKLILQYTTMGIIICNNNEEIVEANKDIFDLLGFNKNELVGKKFSDFFEIEDDYLTNIKELFDLDTNKTRLLQLSFMSKTGAQVEIDSYLNLIEISHQLYLVFFLDEKIMRKNLVNLPYSYEQNICYKNQSDEIFYCQALKELREVNNLLIKKVDMSHISNARIEKALDKERKINEFKTRFVSIASHELRTPLGGILTSASLIENYNETGTKEQRQKHISIIKSQVRNLNTIIDDFLTFDRLEQPEIRVNLKMFSLKELFYELIEKFNETSIKKHKITYEHKGNSDLIFQDSEMLSRILNNIISNALKYSLQEKVVEITSEVKRKNICIKVKDRGIGIPSSDKKFVFDLFYRAENTSGIQGTGLGLSIAKRCLDLIGGTMNFESEVGQGSVFTLIFPRDLEL